MSDKTPENFLELGQRVVAIKTVWDLPGNEDKGIFHAHEGDEGVVVHVEPNFYPTVEFDRTGTKTDVTPQEVRAL